MNLKDLESSLKSDLPWRAYALDFDTDELELKTEPAEDSSQLSAVVEVPFAWSSNDMEGWMAKTERKEEFFSLYASTSYDILSKLQDNLELSRSSNHLDSKDQVAEYGFRALGKEGSYVEDSISAEEIDEILSNRTTYSEHLDKGRNAEIVV